VWAGSHANPVQIDEVEEWIVQAAGEYRPCHLVFDPHQTADLMQRLRRRGVPVEQFDFGTESVSRIAVTLHQLIRAHRLALPLDEELREELLAVRLREPSPGRFRIDHDPDKHDDRAIALALAATFALERTVRPGPRLPRQERVDTPMVTQGLWERIF
jgi:phage terminase large subunit-like protein